MPKPKIPNLMDSGSESEHSSGSRQDELGNYKEAKGQVKFRFADMTKYAIPTQLMRRPAVGNTSGLAATVAINSYPIMSYPRKNVYQYDVSYP